MRSIWFQHQAKNSFRQPPMPSGTQVLLDPGDLSRDPHVPRTYPTNQFGICAANPTLEVSARLRMRHAKGSSAPLYLPSF